MQRSISRRLIETAGDIIEQAYKGSEDVLELINRAEQRLSAICEYQISGEIEPLGALMGDVLEQSKRAHNTILLIVCPNVVGGFSPPSKSGELYQSRGVFPVGLQSLGQGLV